MKITFLSDNMNFSGGRKLLFEYAEFLRGNGHSVTVLVQEKRGNLAKMLEVTTVKDFSSTNIPESDLIVATTPREVKQAFDSGKSKKIVHFCQGFEITDLEQRIEGTVIPPRFKKSGILNKLSLARKKQSWARKKEKTDKIYKLPTTLLCVSKHLKDELENRYKRKVYLCVNGINNKLFHPSKDFKWEGFSESDPMRIINIGPYKVTFKGISVTYEAIRKIKEAGFPVKFIRVSPKFLDEEHDLGIVDEFHENIEQGKLAELLRSAHVYISNSTEGEGFGLPAMEAVSSGLICVLSAISSYKNFSENENFCLFVPEGDADLTVEALKKIFDFTEDQAYAIRENALKTSSNYTFEKSCIQFEEILQEIYQS